MGQYLCDDSVQSGDQHQMVHGRRVAVEADFEHVVVVRGDAETRHEAVHVQVKVLTHHPLNLGEGFAVGGWVEQQSLK